MPNPVLLVKYAAIALIAWIGLTFQLMAEDSVDFKTDVMPVMTKLGCNAGSCHGSAAGRGGFKLSLYGSRPDADFRAIVLEGKGRRINHADFEKSLFLRKPGGELEHGGEQRFELDDPAGKILTAWIRQGAEFSGNVDIESLDVGSSPLLLKPDGGKYQFRIVATFSDGSQKDVTRWTVLTSDDSMSVKIDSDTNVANITRPGRHMVIARYLNIVKPIEILVPYYELADPNDWVAGENFIDDFVYEKLNQLRIPATDQTDDAGFLRRVSIDLSGRLPTTQQIESFLADQSLHKRERLVHELLASHSFTDFWTWRIAQQLRIRSQQNDSTGARVYHNWLLNQIESNESWKETARALLLSSGDSHQNGPANFFRTTGDARLQAEFVTESLLGIKLRCANCHDHPLDQWTQDDYHGLAAIFARVRQSRFVSLNPQGENIHADTGKPATPRVPGEFFIPNDEADIRVPFADWMLDDANPYFARAMVNRIWKSLMGRGLVEPVDDLRNTNPATHPALLKRLADDFIEHDFDFRHTIAHICSSQAYQRGKGNNDGPEFHRRFYANANIRPLDAEVLADAICDVTGISEKYPGQPLGTRAIQLFDSRIPSKSLELLGRCSREESCESSGENLAGRLSSQLHLINGELINEKIKNGNGILRELIRAKTPAKEIVTIFYVRALGRRPSQEESDYWIAQIEKPDRDNDEEGRTERLEDFLWSILNSKEFTTNH